MTKNLISVSQLTNENNVIAEFHSTFCLIKDKEKGQVLFRGVLKDGLYQLAHAQPQDVSSSALSNCSIVTSNRCTTTFVLASLVNCYNIQSLSSSSNLPSI